MARLYRPHIPLEVRCRVARRQLGLESEVWGRSSLGRLLEELLMELSARIGCEASDLRLDHDPPLAARPQIRQGLGKTRYVPEANDPDHLAYRPHGPEYAGSHLIKTNVRGDHGQHPDRVLIKRERRRQREAHGGTHKSIRKMANKNPIKNRQKIQSRPLRGGTRWPPKGSRPFGGRRP